MKPMNPKTLANNLSGILTELNSMVSDLDIGVDSMSINNHEVEIVLSKSLPEFERELISKNLSKYGGAYSKVWFTTRFDGDERMNFHISLV